MNRVAALHVPWFAACLSLFGCNAVLGIDRPSDLVTDSPSPVDSADAGADPASVEVDPEERTNDTSLDAGRGDAAPILDAVAHAWAEWPMPNPGSADVANHQSYLSMPQGVVTDAVTELQWQKDVDANSYSWSEAADYCSKLTLARGGFRLPTRIELLSIIDYTENRPTIDATAFPQTPADKFWSASPFAGAKDNAWLINFDFGTGFVFAADTQEKHRVRCVR